jgi:hypothetical protein
MNYNSTATQNLFPAMTTQVAFVSLSLQKAWITHQAGPCRIFG